MFYRDGKNKLIIADKLIADKMSIYLSSSGNQDIKRNTLRNCETLLQNAAQKDKSPLLTFYFVNDIFKIVYATVMDFLCFATSDCARQCSHDLICSVSAFSEILFRFNNTCSKKSNQFNKLKYIITHIYTIALSWRINSMENYYFTSLMIIGSNSDLFFRISSALC